MKWEKKPKEISYNLNVCNCIPVMPSLSPVCVYLFSLRGLLFGFFSSVFFS